MIRNAEVALLESKESNSKSYSLYKESYDDEIKVRFNLMNYLEYAIDYDEISLVFQPIVDSINDKVIGYEALTRWYSPTYGNVAPDVFIEMAENTGFIIILGEFIIKKSFEFAKLVNGKDGNIRVSINISPRQLYDEAFFTMFKNHMDEMGVEPHMIAVEITESVYMENMDVALEVFNKFRQEGIKVYLDDFGTGYSSLSYIQDLPIDVIKIDKSFVDRIDDEGVDHSMIQVFMDLAMRMKLDVIAEGVETQQQLQVLSELGCHNIQGYYYSKPMTKEAILVL